MHGWHDATEHEATAQTANECGTENPFIEYILFALHQSALAARDAEIARLQAILSDAQDAVNIRQHALEQRTAENELLQARLDAGPSVAQLWEWERRMPSHGYRAEMRTIAIRMEAANGK